MNRCLLTLFFTISIALGVFAQLSTASNTEHKIKWCVNPFDDKIFVQNLGQFDSSVVSANPVLYGTVSRNVDMYFTSNGVIYKYTEPLKSIINRDNDPDKNDFQKPVVKYFMAEWIGANPAAVIQADSVLSYYYAYSIGNPVINVRAQVYKKLTYKNLYPGIDVEYFFPTKGGVKYNILVHPGADITMVKLRYTGVNNLKLDERGNVIVKTDMGNFIDHAPVSYYTDNSDKVNVRYMLHGFEEGFISSKPLNTSREFDIDPWQTDPFPGTAPFDKVYDVDYDNLGNVYGFGSGNPFKLIKLNNAGVIQWVYNAAIFGTVYGDFAVDKVTGTSYLTEGYNGSGAKALKVNTLGALTATFPGTFAMNELWRVEYDECSHVIVCGAGGTGGTNQACTIDTTLTTLTPQNVMGVATSFHDVCLLAVDPDGKTCYMCSTSDAIDTGNANNFLFKLPMPSLTPTVYSARDGFHFREDGTVAYIGLSNTGGYFGNGYNGIAASMSWLYLYDGGRLEKLNKNTGGIVGGVRVTPLIDDGNTPYNLFSGGLAVDICENIYLGYDSAVITYNTALSPTSTLIVPTTQTYDIQLDTAHKNMYVGGNALIMSANLPASPPPTITKQRTSATCSACNGIAQAELTFCGNPDTVNVTYAWSNGQTTQTITGLCAGVYTVHISITLGCNIKTFTDTVLISNSSASGSLTVTKTINNELCFGGNTGSISFGVTGGTGPYTYTWSPVVSVTSSAAGLTAGTYTCNIKDAGCDTGVEVVTITQPTTITTTPSSTPSSCSANNGSATITAGGGTGGYTYSWNGGQTTSAINNVSAGTYTVTVTDANNCNVVANVTVTTTGATITPATSLTNVLCNGGNTGSASVTGVVGGTEPYTYTWSNGQTGTNATGLTAATYTVTVTDNNGCTGTQTATITQPNAITTTPSSTSAACGSNTGSATITAGGGTGGYTYSWNGGQTTSAINNVSAGTYTVTVTDANNCNVIANVTVNSTGATITPTATSTNLKCFGGNTGTASVTAVVGGASPYTYSWSNGQTGTNATGLSAGVYTATVTDNNGCIGTSSVTITSPSQLRDSIVSSVNINCNGGNDGSISVGIKGGTLPYSYSWSSGQTSSNISLLTAGSYTITVTDANGCNVTANTTLTQPAAISLTPASTGASCGVPNGSASITAAGGSAGYTYNWNSGQTTSSINAIVAGNYTVTVTDTHGCKDSVTIVVPNSNGPGDSIVSTVNVSCYNGNNGSITLGVKNGSLPYTFSWSNAATTQNLTTLTVGSYSVTVTDNNGCITTASATITEPGQLRDSITSSTNIKCAGNNNGIATVGVKGGAGPYTYAWAPGGQTGATANGLSANTYAVTLTDGNGCTNTATVTITEPATLTIKAAGFPTTCSVCNGQVVVIPSGGTTPYSYFWNNGSTNASQTGMCAGTDSIYVTDANGCVHDTAVAVTQPPGLRDSIVTTVNVLCNGGNTGSSTVGVKGGTGPYTYVWTNGQTNATAATLTAGNYTITVTDKAGCKDSAISTISQPSSLTAMLSPPSTICVGQSAIITATPVGGTSPYTYSWNTGATTSSIAVSPVTTISYTVTITDANGCTAGPVSVTITVNPPITVTTLPAKSTCAGGSVTLGANAVGGDGTYTYTWNPGGQIGPSITVSPGITTTYTITVTDGCGSPATSLTEIVTVNPLPTVSFKVDTTNGCYPVCINFKDMTTVNSGNISTWKWTFGDGGTSTNQNPNYCYSTPGVYTISLTVLSDSGCVSSQTISNMITVYDHPHADFTASPQPITIVNPTITFTDQSTDAYGIANWLWNFRDITDSTSTKQNPSHTYIDTGTFCPTLIVTNMHGCIDSITKCIVVEPFFTLYIPNAFTPDANGINDVFKAKGNYVCGFQMYIFDRWGMQIFYTEDINKGWNGIVNGNSIVAQEDTYIYLIYAVDCVQQKKHQYLGKVSLIR